MKLFKLLLIIVLTPLSIFIGVSLIQPPSATGVEKIGISYSHTFSEYLGIPWEESFSAMLNELNPSMVRIPVYWNVIEVEKGVYDFSVYDTMMEELEEREIETVLVVGRRVPRWPECHIPDWSIGIPYDEQNKLIRKAIAETVERYRGSTALKTWQVENEPFLPHFGECPPPDGEALDSAVRVVEILDPKRPIMVTDSGELSLWIFAAQRGDIFGTTMYRTVWSDVFSPYFGYITYPLPPKFFWGKANLVHLLHGHDKRIIVSELQGEPWIPGSLRNSSKETQEEAFSFDDFKETVSYAEEVGFPEVYLWGVEWWYYIKETREDARFWDEARNLIERYR